MKIPSDDELLRLVLALALGMVCIAGIWKSIISPAKGEEFSGLESYGYIQIHMGKTLRSTTAGGWQGQDDVACMVRVGWKYGSRSYFTWGVEYDHHSQCFLGEPFNDREEDSLDAITVYGEYRIQ